MSTNITRILAVASLAVAGHAYAAQDTLVTGGQTNVLLDLDALSGAGLDVSGVSDEVITPGALGAGSVAFPINDRRADKPTTFAYTVPDLAPFSGTIEHVGQIFFDQQFAVGDLSIGFDAARATGGNSGFFVESTEEGFLFIAEVLFDVAAPTVLEAREGSLTIEADLLVSPELAGFLGNPALAGADVGDARISATAATATGCRVDLDGDGEATLFDFLEFQTLFAGGDLSADFDGDGALTVFDFLAFQNAFIAGCG